MQEKNMIFLKKKNMSFPNRGEGGSPTWEKFPHFPVFFWGELPLASITSTIITPLLLPSQYYQYQYYSVPSQHCQYNSIRRQYPRIPRNRDGNGFLIKDAMEAIIVGMSRALSIIGTPFRRRINQC